MGLPAAAGMVTAGVAGAAAIFFTGAFLGGAFFLAAGDFL